MTEELRKAGSLNVFWFFASVVGLLITIFNCSGLWALPFVSNVCTYFVLEILVINLLLLLRYEGFTYATTVRSSLLGSVCALGVYVAVRFSNPWSIVGWYLIILSGFHFSEFLSIAWCNTNSLSVSSFILNHSREYWIALAASWIEFIVEVYFCPGIKAYSILSSLGIMVCIIGEVLRKTAMFTASTNFNHLVQLEKEDSHELVTHGIYQWCRHPSYLGWFLWSIGTQVLLLNPVCTVAYIIVSWKFFDDRITVEEWYLLDFFGEQYREYQEKVPSGIPFVQGMVIKKTQ